MSRMQQQSELFVAMTPPEIPSEAVPLMERILSRDNMRKAYRRVVSNKGAPGVDGMTVGKLGGYLRRHWLKIRESLMDGSYRPLPVRAKEIAKPDGGVRLLGIPTVLDRCIQQAVAQVLGAIWDPTFSESSHGFRPNRSQRRALREAQGHMIEGYRYVVDMDLSKFFDRVNHDRLMHRLATRVSDPRVLKLVRAFLTSGIMIGGLVSQTEEGTPQGGPLSPLLSNIVLDELDKELERRGLRFVRYADDFMIYVKSERAAKRVKASVSRFVTRKLRLVVNEEKSAIGRPWDRKFLGCCFTNARKDPKLRIHWKTIKRFKARVIELTPRSKGRRLTSVIKELMQFLNGWWGYYRMVESKNRLQGLDVWIRRRLRAMVWEQWKNRRTRVTKLKAAGVPHMKALLCGCTRKGPWRMSKVMWINFALPPEFFAKAGLNFPWLSL